ncbi:hypothetical protein R1sor_021166 [Riccia sorocarpa]|uniref:DUF1764 domain-containing protein n=1 Tax=Riccia sorocarpa TaxID=122646 RepID=A0ABD3GG98_9MARC
MVIARGRHDSSEQSSGTCSGFRVRGIGMGSKKKKGGAPVVPGAKELKGKDIGKDSTVLKKEEVETSDLGLGAKGSKATKKSSKSEIDEIFGSKKRKVVAGDSSAAANGTEEVKKKKKKVKSSDVVTQGQKTSEKSASASTGISKKKTLDGFTVYSEDEIGWNKKNAGGTPLCPFDCECCF